MKSLILAFCLAATALAAPNGGGEIWYERPAADWNSALPVGNGSLGAMIHGHPAREHLQFNEETLWTGDDTAMGAYQPFGDLFIDLPAAAEFSNYRRALHLADAVHETRFFANGVNFTREIFASHPDQVIVNIEMNYWLAEPTNLTECHLPLFDWVEKGLLGPVGQGGSTHTNLFNSHPPFQIDGNFGATSGITEMLLQSHLREADGRYVIHLLPALPAAWPAGAVRGLLARGGFEVDLDWADGALTRATLRSVKGGRAVVVVGGERQDLELAAGESKAIKPHARAAQPRPITHGPTSGRSGQSCSLKNP